MVGLRSGADQAEAAQTHTAITSAHAGNVVLYGSGWDSSALVASTTRALQQRARDANAGVGLFISGNQEGGQAGAFQAFYGEGFTPMPSAITQAQGDPVRLQEQARVWGVQLRDAGVNLNLAPVLDVVPPGTASTNDPIGYWGREYGFSPEDVTAYGMAFARGMRAAPVAVSVKHFPGLGRVRGNTDFTAEGIVDDQFSGADDPYLQPYRVAIQDGVEFVMVSLAVYPRVDSRQAVFSSVIMRDILRQQLGFRNVVLSDDVGAAAAVADRAPAQRALDFLRAGGDVLLTVRPSDAAPMTQALLREIAADAAFRADLDASLERVLRVKAGLGLLPAAP
jgi:beta-N-acetylhexosaminidase